MPPEVSASPDRPANYGAARVLVIIMSVLVALAFVAVVWGFIRQSRILMESRATAAAQPVSAPAQGGIVLPPGAKIVSSSTDAGRLVLRLQTPQGEEVRIIDLASGRQVQTIKTQP
jgi:hypothetical protein